ncbi:MAG: hypothetical protein PF795_01875 [Kiritimatiellae bacterium]|nr:hypothetical protein [Kiritimatiellia bacterium]
MCYNHPAVDVVNLWGFGPKTWQARTGGGGLLDIEGFHGEYTVTVRHPDGI